MTLDSQAPEPGQSEFLLSKAPSLWPFGRTAPGNKYTVTPGRSHWLGASVGEGHRWGPEQGTALGGEGGDVRGGQRSLKPEALQRMVQWPASNTTLSRDAFSRGRRCCGGGRGNLEGQSALLGTLGLREKAGGLHKLPLLAGTSLSLLSRGRGAGRANRDTNSKFRGPRQESALSPE